MTYSEKKKQQNKQIRNLIINIVFISAFVAIVAVAGFITGAGLGVGIGKPSPPIQNTIQGDSDVLERAPKYGTRDGRVFAGVEMSRDWVDDKPFFTVDCPLDESTQQFIYYLSEGYFIDFPFVMGLIQQESTFRPKIISASKDYGLMQINVVNHEWLKKEFGITDLLDPVQNVRAGLYILRGLFEKYDDPAKVIMAYNLGEYGAKVLWDKGIYETEYTNKVLAYANVFENQLSKGEMNND